MFTITKSSRNKELAKLIANGENEGKFNLIVISTDYHTEHIKIHLKMIFHPLIFIHTLQHILMMFGPKRQFFELSKQVAKAKTFKGVNKK